MGGYGHDSHFIKLAVTQHLLPLALWGIISGEAFTAWQAARQDCSHRPLILLMQNFLKQTKTKKRKPPYLQNMKCQYKICILNYSEEQYSRQVDPYFQMP